MGRSWTPRETYEADKYLQNTQGKSIRIQFEFVYTDGKKEKLNKLDNKTCERYPELSFLFNEGLAYVIEKTTEHPIIRNRLLDEIEEKVVKYENNKKDEVNKTDTVWLWFTGELDKNFYYNNVNDKMFAEYIIEECNKRANNKNKSKNNIPKEYEAFNEFVSHVESAIKSTNSRLIQITISDPYEIYESTGCSIKYYDRFRNKKSNIIKVPHIFNSNQNICRDKILIKKDADTVVIEMKNRKIIDKDGVKYISFEYSDDIDYNKTKDFNSRLTDTVLDIIKNIK